MKYTILIVDDSAVVRTLHALILRSDGFITLEAENGFTALEMLISHPCHLAIVDVNMPRMDGITLVRNIRANLVTQNIPIIMVSTQIEARDKMKGLEAGVNSYLVKPTDPDKLLDEVRNLLNI